MSDLKAYAATPAATLEQKVMDANVPKSEAEWWAKREIERLNNTICKRDDEIKQLQNLFRIDGKQHAAHIEGLKEQWQARLSKYAAEIERLQCELEHSEVTIDDLEKTHIKEIGFIEQEIEQLKSYFEEWERLSTDRDEERDAEVKRLRDEIEQLEAACNGRIEVATNLQMKCERLRTALRPFADLCTLLSRAHLNGGPDDEEVSVKIGLLRQAYRALEEEIT